MTEEKIRQTAREAMQKVTDAFVDSIVKSYKIVDAQYPSLSDEMKLQMITQTFEQIYNTVNSTADLVKDKVVQKAQEEFNGK